ncbi:hypothetical protein [Curtobacterium sp. MCBD17_032]|uniref:hypothetical protein n=1 Tax=Curtobacterium sp. MCBD17_032 TaxID=2175659 RepID=UPI000DA99351|nr:hypothetical protein [Curtobacterium sp. MCBD17_032]PZE79708.1 hypothetical protein DEI91_15350 [Curtobacterium sp. MCBD17_032]
MSTRGGGDGRLRRGVTAASVLLGVLLLVAGCFATVPPPRGSAADLRALLAGVERVPGVRSVTGEVRQVDAKDRPQDWIAVVSVRAAGDDLSTAARVRERARAGVRGTELVLDVAFPAGDGTAAVTVDPMDDALVDVADRLRREPFVRSAVIDDDQSRVEVRDGPTLTDAVERVRSDAAGRTVVLSSDTGEVEVTATAPSAALLRVLDAAHAEDVSSTAGRTYAAAASGWAAVPAVTAAVRDPEAVARLLAATPDEQADARLAPRTRFSLRHGDGPRDADPSSGPTEGYLGLPLGSPDPDDASAPRTPTPTDGAAGTAAPWTPADVPDQTAAVRSFLQEAVRRTGVAAAVTTTTEQCAPDGSSSASGPQEGTRAVARVEIPVFTRYDDAQEPFDRVTAGWTAAGFRKTGRALGLDSWAPPRPGQDGVASATIRGGTGGLRLSAESACVG